MYVLFSQHLVSFLNIADLNFRTTDASYDVVYLSFLLFLRFGVINGVTCQSTTLELHC